MATDINLNQNAADCIKSINNIGTTVYTNICSGTETTLHWGGLDWVGFGIVATFATVVVLGLLTLLVSWFVVGFIKGIRE